jgi:hypothetical protein
LFDIRHVGAIVDIHTNFAELTDEALAAYAEEVRAEFDRLIADPDPTDEKIAEAESYADNLDAVRVEQESRVTASEERATRLAGLRERFSETPAEDEPAEDEPAEDDEEEDEEEEEETKIKVAGKNVARLAARTRRPKAPEASQHKAISITAAADVPQFSTGQSLEGLEEVAKAVINRARGFTAPTNTVEGEPNLQQFGTAMFGLDFPEDLTVDRLDDAQEVMTHAANESRLPKGSLVAAGGWCAPSETVYDLSNDATAEGLVSLPEIAVKRGGIRFATSPDFAAFYANPGFTQTEAQAIAGTTKPCVEVPCPPFTEVRLDAVGICIKVPILTNAAYPEVVANFISGSMIAHQHYVNTAVINKMVTAAGAAKVFAGLGAVSTDTLEALGLIIDNMRQKWRLSLGATVEVVLPFWVKNAIRTDLARRNGRDSGAVTDAEVTTAISSYGASAQFVYDWQALPADSVKYPATFQALVYPAGTFVKGTSDVINLNTVYDAASLAVNTYTGLFMEEGILVAQMKLGAVLATIPICDAGRTGSANLVCA